MHVPFNRLVMAIIFFLLQRILKRLLLTSLKGKVLEACNFRSHCGAWGIFPKDSPVFVKSFGVNLYDPF